MSKIGDSGFVGKAQNFSQDEIGSKPGDFKPKLSSKSEVKGKLDSEKMKKGAKKLGSGVKKGTNIVSKRTAGAILVGLSVITRNKLSKEMVKPGMELLTGGSSKETKFVGDDYGVYKREMIGQKAQKMKGKAMQSLGSGMQTIGEAMIKKS